MVPQNLSLWSISRKQILESQQKLALRNRFLRTLLCSDDIFNPGYNRIMPRGKEHPFLKELVLNLNSCLIQYNAPLVEYVNVVQEINSFCQT